ncbi:cleavage stimulation factor subunit 2 [Colletotrichum spaethianum]|uniref:Cleavage stimulation factor subunit 2 n=1 Tax=Colletotrichum spaethianum TaxID=700344 RepID=A0AA37UQ37_9PEZI|nr:cleavage stimulation factor subunit 2 [Colletotrichum spaethianum]GKT48062.1 cleavage stimulation factor subunit 2 [Colletotrichum spaethianum]
MSKPPSRVVFVGNIPYGLSEEQISDIFSSAGKVLNFRLVYDRETGRPKGFGFAEYPDNDSAASAVRNLNDYEIMGRKLRVDFSNEGGSDGNDDNHGHMKALASSDPARATELLQQAPQLAYAVFQALLLMGLVSPEAIHSVIEAGGAPSAAPAQAAPIGYPPQPSATGFPPVPVPGATNTPPVAGTPYAPPPQQAPYGAPPPPAAAALGQDPDALMRQVMELPMETINMLPEAERQQILALRASFGGQRR